MYPEMLDVLRQSQTLAVRSVCVRDRRRQRRERRDRSVSIFRVEDEAISLPTLGALFIVIRCPKWSISSEVLMRRCLRWDTLRNAVSQVAQRVFQRWDTSLGHFRVR